MIFDLHLHTNYSDGLFTPEEVVDLAIKRNLNGIAITDHDTVDGIEPAIEYNKKLGQKLHIIPGIEFGSTYLNEDVHILGYFIDYKSKELLDIIKELKDNRFNRGLEIINKLKEAGFNIELSDVKPLAKTGLVSRSHIAQVLKNKGYVNSVEEAFNMYLNRGQVGYVEKKSLSVVDTINLIHKLEGIAILAHPGLIKNKEIIQYCIDKNVDGMEVIHSKHNSEDFNTLFKIARKNNLIVTGGSDCHGKLKNGDYLLGKYYININYIPTMKERI